jgi:hypothetical protein
MELAGAGGREAAAQRRCARAKGSHRKLGGLASGRQMLGASAVRLAELTRRPQKSDAVSNRHRLIDLISCDAGVRRCLYGGLTPSQIVLAAAAGARGGAWLGRGERPGLSR